MSAPPPSFVPAIQTGKPNRARFYPRRYPVLRGLSIILYCLAGLVAIDLVAWLAFFTAGAGAALVDRSASDGAGLGFVVLALFALIVHGASIAWLMLPAELIKLFLDIQHNTQEAAHNSRNAG